MHVPRLNPNLAHGVLVGESSDVGVTSLDCMQPAVEEETEDRVWVFDDHKDSFGTGYKASADIKVYVIQLGNRIKKLVQDGKLNLYTGNKANPNNTDIFRETFQTIAGFTETTYRNYAHEAEENENTVGDAAPTRKKRRLELEFPTLCDAVCKMVDEAKVGGFLTKAKIYASLTQEFEFSCSQRHGGGISKHVSKMFSGKRTLVCFNA